MRFYTKQHKFFCGNDLHARTMYLFILDQERKIVLHRDIKANPETFLSVWRRYQAYAVTEAKSELTGDLQNIKEMPLIMISDKDCFFSCQRGAL